jgi:hypothetical protein
VRGACAATLLAVAPSLNKPERGACRARTLLALERAMQQQTDADLQHVLRAAHSALLVRPCTTSPDDDDIDLLGAACMAVAEVLCQAVHNEDDTRQLAAILAFNGLLQFAHESGHTTLSLPAAAATAAALVGVLRVPPRCAHPHALLHACMALLLIFLLDFGPEAKRAGTAAALRDLLRTPMQQLPCTFTREVATKLLDDIVGVSA